MVSRTSAEEPALSKMPLGEILVVDDDPFQCKLIARQLNYLGFERFAVCASAAEALCVLDGRRPERCLMLLDLNMPDMDGIELIRHLGMHRRTIDLVLVSGAEERILDTITRLAGLHGLRVLGQYAKPMAAEDLQVIVSRWQSHNDQHSASPRKVYCRTQIRRALDEEEFTNFYQPKVDVATGAAVGVETLVRWRSPTDGLVMPDQFISVAEETAEIDDLTRYAMALGDAQAWRQQGISLPVAINVSMDNLVSLDFPDVISTELDRTNTAPSDITREVTESRLMTPPKESLEILTRLSLKNIRLSIDDFGTGHSSLAQLRDIPFAELKIDRGFVHGACRSARRGTFEGCLKMAQTRDMKVVAEGVEDCADWEFLREHECEHAQGYWFARPMPGEQIHEWLDEWKEPIPKLLTQ